VSAVAIDEAALGALLQREIGRARRAGVQHIRDGAAFTSHLVRVGRRAAEVAGRLQRLLPAAEAPDPVSAFVAGVWHDGGKIWNGDDYHEITGALEVLERGVEWQLARGPRENVADVLKRAACAIVPHFAILEQWRDDYRPASSSRDRIAPLMDRLRTTLAQARPDDRWLLPLSVDSLILAYSDLVDTECLPSRDEEFDTAFRQRWGDVERSARVDDPPLAALLPGVRPRLYAGCALIHRFLTRGYDEAALHHVRQEMLAAT
jgi:hypothetical protein